ncbi:hypothetical protein ACFCWD_36935 [Streptomyces sp. NPDC056374]|uniref:hypothetical protein n=1 Tax=unclassified Streptomyces TaxID=2593676 RepID=UPI0035D72309
MEAARTYFGDRFVSYCINASAESLDSIDMSAAQLAAIGNLEFIANRAKSNGNDFSIHLARADVMRYVNESAVSIPNALRESCGGSVNRRDSSDPLEEALLEIASSSYPATLFPAPSPETPADLSSMITSSLAFQRPSSKPISQLILGDPSLVKLFPGAPPAEEYEGVGFDITSMIYWSTGTGASIQLGSFASSLLQTAKRGMSSTSTADDYFDLASKALQDARSLARTRKAKTKALVGFSNVSLSAGSVIKLSGGSLRPFTFTDHHAFIDPKNVQSVLEVDCDIEILGVEDESSADGKSSWDPYQRDLVKHQAELRRRVDLERLAILFSCEEAPHAPLGVATTVINPISLNRAVSFSVHHSLSSHHPTLEIDSAAAARMVEWSTKISGSPANLDMGMRRLLSAVSERFDPMDSFVDAVICWENLFGTNQGEVGFRIAASIAHLLFPADSVERRKLFEEVKRMYGIRSKLVHGSKEPDFLEAIKHRERSIEIAVDAFKALSGRADLLKVDSSGRGSLLLIGS